jgi:hypothetical protein
VEGLFVAELHEWLRIVLHQADQDALERLIVFDARVLLVRVLPSVLEGRVGRRAVTTFGL